MNKSSFGRSLPLKILICQNELAKRELFLRFQAFQEEHGKISLALEQLLKQGQQFSKKGKEMMEMMTGKRDKVGLKEAIDFSLACRMAQAKGERLWQSSLKLSGEVEAARAAVQEAIENCWKKEAIFEKKFRENKRIIIGARENIALSEIEERIDILRD